MEPIAIITLFVLAIGADKHFSEDVKPVVSASERVETEIVDDTQSHKIFARGSYILSPDGYYISNLTPDPTHYAGCEQPVLVADLSHPNYQKPLPVDLVNVGCGE